MARERVDRNTVCGVCGGIGHAGSVDGLGQCLTARLGHRIPSDHLSQIKYPDGYSPPKFFHGSSSNRNSSTSKRFPNSNRHHASYTNRRFKPNSQSHRYSNSRPHARYIDEHDASPSSNYPSPEEIAHEVLRASAPGPSAEEIAYEALRLAKAHYSKPRFDSRFKPRRPVPRRPTTYNRARSIERENDQNADDTQNVDHDADDYSDDDEHARLAVAFDAVQF